MQKQECSHFWEMINVANGLVVMKKCFHCAKVSTCFIFHNYPPLEPCYEQEHFWNFMESDPALHFDLKCTKCSTLVKLDELVGLMFCTGCDQTCDVDILRRKLEPENTRIYIALGHRPIDERKKLSEEKISILRRKQVEKRTGLSRSTSYLRIQEGTFPRPIKLGARAVGWLENEIEAWLAARMEIRDNS